MHWEQNAMAVNKIASMLYASARPLNDMSVSICLLCGQRAAGKPAGCSVRGREWTQEQIAAAERGVVAVLYASAYGNTAALAQAISRGVTKAGELAVCFQLGSVAFVSLCVTGASAPCAEAHAACHGRCGAV